MTLWVNARDRDIGAELTNLSYLLDALRRECCSAKLVIENRRRVGEWPFDNIEPDGTPTTDASLPVQVRNLG